MDLEMLEFGNPSEWRSWLKRNHLRKKGVWLVFRRKGAHGKSIDYGAALDDALAFGWIDSLIRKIDEERYARKFTPRRPESIWSKFNIDRVKELKKGGRMTRWGLELYENRTGKRYQVERFEAEGRKTIQDLEQALRRNKKAWQNYKKMAPSHRKRYMIWISGAKRPETEQRRIKEAVNLISQNVKDLLK